MEMRWIPCNERMPEEYDSIFAKAYGTERWRASMFRKRSNTVLVTVVLADGSVISETGHTQDGNWDWNIKHRGLDGVVIAWMPLPAPFEEQKEKTAGTDWLTNRFMRVE